jgi:hypothetical protein
MHYAIVSDGCSSSEYSEIGANILCHVAKDFLLSFYATNIITETSKGVLQDILQYSIYKRANEIRKMLHIPHDALNATLFMTFMIDNTYANNTWVYGWGDGTIILNYGTLIEIIKYEYESGAPFYLSYLSNENYNTYKNKFGDKKIIRTIYSIPNDSVINITTKTIKLDFSDFPSYLINQYSPSVNKETIKSVIISSDGLTSYIKNKDVVPTLTICHELLGYKRITGEFMKSNIVFMNKKHKKEFITHYDDMSVGIVLREK